VPYRDVEFRADHYYHLYNRGHNKQTIFFERENYLFFLRRLRKYLVPDVFELVAYCLMPNHYHFLIHLKMDDLSARMQPFALSYTKAINKRYDRKGGLFQGPFRATLVETDEYLLHLSRYIHLNPVTAGLVAKAEDWEFSSYRDYIGLRSGTLPTPDIVLAHFPSPAAYQAFVEAYTVGDEEIIRHLMLD